MVRNAYYNTGTLFRPVHKAWQAQERTPRNILQTPLLHPNHNHHNILGTHAALDPPHETFVTLYLAPHIVGKLVQQTELMEIKLIIGESQN